MTMNLWLHRLCLVGLLMSGCATYRARPIAPEQTAADFDSRSLADPKLQEYLSKTGAGSKTWDLETLTHVGFFYHPDLEVARSQWAVARAGRITAGERPNPTLNIAPEYATNEPPDSSPWVLAVLFDVPIETAGKRGYRQHQAESLSEAARLHIARVAWQVRSRVRSSLLTLYAAQQANSILLEQQKQLKANRELLEQRSKNGYVSPLTLTQAEVLAGKTDVILNDQERLAETARAQLASALGLPLHAIKDINFSFNSFDEGSYVAPENFQTLRQQAIKSRTDILESLAVYASNQSALQLEIAKQYPDIHLGPGYIFDQGVNRWVLSFLSALPIFNKNRGAITEAQARRDQAAANFNSLQDQVIGDIDRALVDYASAYRKLQTANTLLSTHLEQEKTLHHLLHPGDLSRLTLFRSQLDIDSTRLIAADARVQFLQTQGALEDAFERPLNAHAAAIPDQDDVEVQHAH